MKESFEAQVPAPKQEQAQKPTEQEIIARELERENTADGLLIKIGELLKGHPKMFRAFKAALVTFMMSGGAGEAFAQTNVQESGGAVQDSSAVQVDAISKENLDFVLTRSAYMELDRSEEYKNKTYSEKMGIAGGLAKKLEGKLDYITSESQAVLAGILIRGDSVSADDPSTFDAWEDVLKKAEHINESAVSFLNGLGSYENPEKASEALDAVEFINSSEAADKASEIIVSHEQLVKNDWSSVDFGKLTESDIKEIVRENKVMSKVTPEVVSQKIK